MPHPFVEAAGPVEAIAHRGGDLDPAENTLAAFAAAVALGYRHLETDVHATADGVLVAFHDATLDRVTDRTGPIAALTWQEVSTARVGPDGTGRIPRFDELVASFPNVRLTVDLKADAAVAPMLARLTGDTALLARTCIGSFAQPRVRAVRAALGRRVCTSAGPREVLRLRATSWSRVGRPSLGADCLQVPQRVGALRLIDGPFLAAAERAGLPVHVWTVNDPATMGALIDRGVTGIVTDAVRELRGVLEQRGLWGSGT
jgi:glycerophosphoryl diester phosphodiesterase